MPPDGTDTSAAIWRTGAGYQRVAAALAGPGGDTEDMVERVERLFGVTTWFDAMLTPLIAGLAADPWFEPPVRTNRDGLHCGAILVESSTVAVSVLIPSAARLRAVPSRATLVFSGRQSVTKYLKAGGARLRRWQAPPLSEPCLATAMGRARPLPDQPLTDGMILRLNGRTDSHAVTDAVSDVVTLSATVRANGDPVAREYDAAHCDFLRMATNDDGAARAQLLLSLLRVAGGTGAADTFAAATHDHAYFLRWSAMREWLAHDWQAAWPRLAEMADDDPHPEVRATATATIAQFIRRAL